MKLAIVLLSGWTLLQASPQVHVKYDLAVHDCLKWNVGTSVMVPCPCPNDICNDAICYESQAGKCQEWTDAKIDCSKSALLATMSNGSLERIRHAAEKCVKETKARVHPGCKYANNDGARFFNNCPPTNDIVADGKDSK